MSKCILKQKNKSFGQIFKVYIKGLRLVMRSVVKGTVV